jgi:hypothetical protein
VTTRRRRGAVLTRVWVPLEWEGVALTTTTTTVDDDDDDARRA